MICLRLAVVTALLTLHSSSWADGPTASPTPRVSAVAGIKAEAKALEPLVKTAPAKAFLGGAVNLPEVSPRVVYRGKEGALTEKEFAALPEAGKANWKKLDLDDQFYYYTRYGTPLAFGRAVEVAAENGFAGFHGARVADFGFGSIGQLRIMASLGTQAHGIEVDPILKALYSDPSDTGTITTGDTKGSVRLHFGYFPGDKQMVADLGTGYDLFVSKNTLKRGYIHPDREADKRMLIDLGVSDDEFVRVVHDMLKPGGLFLIYNLHPHPSKPEEQFVPWSDGRSPFTRETFEKGGFEVLLFDKDDTAAAQEMSKVLGWGGDGKADPDIFGTYTLTRRK